MLFRNLSTNETVNVCNLKMRDGRIFFSVRDKGCGAKFYSHNTMLLCDEEVENGTFLRLADGWEIAKPASERKPRQPRKASAAKDSAPAPAANDANESNSASQPASAANDAQPASQPTPKAKAKATKPAHAESANASQPAANDDLSAAATAFAAAVRAAKSANVDEAKVREICLECIAESASQRESANDANAVTIKVLGNDATHKVSQPHPLLKKVLALVVNDRAIGRYPWLFGPAGSGKSTLAKQVAEALGLPFYSVSSLQQKYELEGYTDAVGELVETTFYKAAKEGGIFLFDEASTTSGEVNVAFNSMLANLWYNFPKVGMINAHKDFHIIAADNTTGRGGNSTYSSRFQLDASTLDRYIAIRVDYTAEMDNFMAENDTELVEFFRDIRAAIDAARLTYTASPRALRCIKQMQKLSDTFTAEEAFELGLCSSWAQSDIVTLNARLHGNNKYYRMFRDIASR